MKSTSLRGWLLDTNVFNHLVDGKIDEAKLLERFSPFVTNVQLEEIRQFEPKTPEEHRRKQLLLKMVSKIPDAVLPTLAENLNLSNSDLFRSREGSTYSQILEALNQINPKRQKSNERDALIGDTAIRLNLELITNDSDLARIVRDLGGQVLDLKHYKDLS
ncbi:MAG: PIN domain-containing protein [Proteobacteria bacterium]|nr:PIN domain-containing protein [Pseudomonadota bacterium]